LSHKCSFIFSKFSSHNCIIQIKELFFQHFKLLVEKPRTSFRPCKFNTDAIFINLKQFYLNTAADLTLLFLALLRFSLLSKDIEIYFPLLVVNNRLGDVEVLQPYC